MCAVQDGHAASGALEGSELPSSHIVSAVSVCPEQHTENFQKPSEQLSIVVTVGAVQFSKQGEAFSPVSSDVSEDQDQRQADLRSAGGEVMNAPIKQVISETSSGSGGLPSSSSVSESHGGTPPVATGNLLSASAFVDKQPRAIRFPQSLAQRPSRASSAVSDDRMDGQDASERGQTPKPDISVLASAVAASKLGLVDQLSQALATCGAVAFAKDAEDRTCLHYAAGYGHEECVSLLLEARSDTRVRDANGDLPLHFAAIHGHPMCAYNITKACPAACLTRNYRGQTPVEVAVACERGEVLNAMLLACAGDGSGGVTVQAMRKLLTSGAVPDTWAPNGSSALMLAAAANGTEALGVLLEAGATLELQDALGRSALMFAAGNCARDTLLALLDAGACISQRDRRGRNVLDYAPSGSEVRRLLQIRLEELEAVANKLQQDLLDSLQQQAAEGPAGAGAAAGDIKAGGGGKKKKQSAAAKKAAQCGAVPAAPSKGGAAITAAASTTSADSNAAVTGTSVSSSAAGNSRIHRVRATDTTADTAGGSGSSVPAAAAAHQESGAAKKAAACSEAPAQQLQELPQATASSSKQLGTSTSSQRQQAGGSRSTMAVATAGKGAGAVGSAGRQGPAAAPHDEEDTSAWQTVSSKCTAKQRQQHQQHYLDSERASNSTSAPAVASGGNSGGHGRTGRACSAGSATSSAPGVVAGAGHGSVPPSSQARAAAAAVKGGPMVPSSNPLSQPGGHPVGKTSAAATAGALPAGVARRRSGPPVEPAVASAAGAGAGPAASAAAAAAPPAPAQPSGFKAALLGLDSSATATAATATGPAVEGQAAAGAPPAAHLTVPAIVVTQQQQQQPSQERKPAWGGVRLGQQPPGAVVEVPGCSPRSYPPLSAVTTTATVVGAPTPSAAATPANATSATHQPQPLQEQLKHGPPEVIGAAATTTAPPFDGLAGDACDAPSSSAAGASAPPSVTSVADSDVPSTGASTSSQPGAGTCSPRSFGHDWTRPSPVDVLLQAALAASSAAASRGGPRGVQGLPDGASSRSTTADGTVASRPGHSKTSSTGSSSGFLSFDGFQYGSSGCGTGTGMSLCFGNSTSASTAGATAAATARDAAGTYPPPAAPSQRQDPPHKGLRQQQQQQPKEGHPGGLSQSLLDGMEVPPPQRRSAGGGAGGGSGKGGAAAEPAAVKVRVRGGASSSSSAAHPPHVCMLPATLDDVPIATNTGGPAAVVKGVAGEAGGRACGSSGGHRGGVQSIAQQMGGGGGGGRSKAGKAGAMQAGAGGGAVSEVAWLKAECEALQRRLRQAEQRHTQELAAVMMDAEQHQGAVVERAIAEERLRVTANLLAIGLCPEAILAVITPPGHGLDIAQLLANSATGTAAANNPSATSVLCSTADNTTSAPRNEPPSLQAVACRASSTEDPQSQAARPRSTGGCVPVGPSATSSSPVTTTEPHRAAVPAASESGGSAGDDTAAAASAGVSEAPGLCTGHAPFSSSYSATASALPRWLDSCRSSCSGSAASGECGGLGSQPAGPLLRPGCGLAPAGNPGNGLSLYASFTSGLSVTTAAFTVSPAIAIPSAAASGCSAAGGFCASGAPTYGSFSSQLASFGSPGGVHDGFCGAGPAGFGGRSVGSLGSGGLVVGSLCGGLGLGALSALGQSACGGGSRMGMLSRAAAAAEEEEEAELDGCEDALPECGDISALLAMSDDDDA